MWACLHLHVSAKPVEERSENSLEKLSEEPIEDTCREPDDVELYKQYVATVTDAELQETVFQVEPATSIFEARRFDSQDKKTRPNHGVGESGSPCPWRNVTTNSALRFPRIFMEAEMVDNDQKYCKDNQGREVINCECMPLPFYTRILKRVDCVQRQGYFTYLPSWQRITLGYIPART